MQRIFIAKLLLACSLALSSALSLALPSPKDIDAAVNAGRLSQAESMLREVIQEIIGNIFFSKASIFSSMTHRAFWMGFD